MGNSAYVKILRGRIVLGVFQLFKLVFGLPDRLLDPGQPRSELGEVLLDLQDVLGHGLELRRRVQAVQHRRHRRV